MTTDGNTRSPLRMLSLRDVAERLGVSVATTRRLVRTQQLPAVRVGHQLRVRPEELGLFVEAHRLPDERFEGEADA